MLNLEVQNIAPYSLELDAYGKINDKRGGKFDLKAYSRMKWGVRSDTKQFAKELVSTLHTEAPRVIEDEKPPGIIVAYQAIPHAATILARYCLDEINTRRTQAQVPKGELVKVYAEDYIEPYSHLSKEARQEILNTQRQTLELERESLMDLDPILIDDILVTGTTTQLFLDLLANHTDRPVTAGYIAIFDTNQAQASPGLEGQLDESDINEYTALLPHIENDNLEFIHRFFKGLLQADTTQLGEFLPLVPDNLLRDTTTGIVQTEGIFDRFRPNCEVIFEHASERKIFECR